MILNSSVAKIESHNLTSLIMFLLLIASLTNCCVFSIVQINGFQLRNTCTKIFII